MNNDKQFPTVYGSTFSIPNFVIPPHPQHLKQQQINMMSTKAEITLRHYQTYQHYLHIHTNSNFQLHLLYNQHSPSIIWIQLFAIYIYFLALNGLQSQVHQSLQTQGQKQQIRTSLLAKRFDQTQSVAYYLMTNGIKIVTVLYME